eukprot:TRINITY_DN54074_c0_g1_i1.p1 TRINITY_DN54074_c0_g1~~TRINITY_DN54074_c0_g1_i1.p1  ORF type:complete len:142 (-),score=13.98 TRINITY_DN54074_c0_g1_i1:168-593(-)
MASLLSAALVRRRLAPLLALPGHSCVVADAAPSIPAGSFNAGHPLCLQRRFYRHRGVLKLHCSECRYVIRKWHVPILAVDCNANKRHKQAMTNTFIRSRWSTQFPDHLAPWVEGKQYPRWPRYRMDETFQCYHKKGILRLR